MSKLEKYRLLFSQAIAYIASRVTIRTLSRKDAGVQVNVIS